MQLFRFNPTIREANRYLNKTVDELLKKHGGVSNEDFEKELAAITGIGWKRVKDYRNHPKPSERLKDNSLVVKYVRECQSRDKTRRFMRISLAAFIVIAAVEASYYFLTKPNPTEQFIIHEVPPAGLHKIESVMTQVFIEIPSRGWTLRVGPLKQSKIPLEKFVCTKLPTISLTNCSLSADDKQGMLQVTVLVDGDMVRKFNVMTFNPKDISDIRKQLATRVDRNLGRTPVGAGLMQDQFKVGQESVQILSSGSGPGSRPMLNISVSF